MRRWHRQLKVAAGRHGSRPPDPDRQHDHRDRTDLAETRTRQMFQL